jgi:hypothetical protein
MKIGKNPYVIKLIGFRQPEKFLIPVICSTLGLTAPFLILYCFLFVSSMYKNFSINHFKVLSYIWQSLITGAFAISAAAMGVTAILYQVNQSQKSEEKSRKRRASALAATFTMALSELCNYASECARINASLFTDFGSGTIRTPGLQFPRIPVSIVKEVSDLIEVSEEDNAKPLISLIQCVQIFNARIADVQRRATGPSSSLLLPINIVARVIDAAELYARAAVLLGSVRRAAPSPADPITFNDVRRSLFVMPAGISNFQVYQDEIDRRFIANGRKPEWPEP